MANRLLQEDSSDARLEAVFGGGPEESGLTLPEGIANINSWDDGAAEVANMIGAEVCFPPILYNTPKVGNYTAVQDKQLMVKWSKTHEKLDSLCRELLFPAARRPTLSYIAARCCQSGHDEIVRPRPMQRDVDALVHALPPNL